jgi:hypothetical protein
VQLGLRLLRRPDPLHLPVAHVEGRCQPRSPTPPCEEEQGPPLSCAAPFLVSFTLPHLCDGSPPLHPPSAMGQFSTLRQRTLGGNVQGPKGQKIKQSNHNPRWASGRRNLTISLRQKSKNGPIPSWQTPSGETFGLVGSTVRATCVYGPYQAYTCPSGICKNYHCSS